MTLSSDRHRLSSVTPTRVLLSVQVKPESKAALAKLANEMALTLSDVSRMCLAKGMEVVQAEYRARRK